MMPTGHEPTLRSSTRAVAEPATAGAGAWPAGSAANRATMERKSGLLPEASLLDWLVNASPASNGRDRLGKASSGAPHRAAADPAAERDLTTAGPALIISECL